jgi:hypothetical protein
MNERLLIYFLASVDEESDITCRVVRESSNADDDSWSAWFISGALITIREIRLKQPATKEIARGFRQ